MTPADLEFLINLMGPKFIVKDTTHRAAAPVEGRLAVYTAVFGYGRFVHVFEKKMHL
jgi:hypothetical protein